MIQNTKIKKHLYFLALTTRRFRASTMRRKKKKDTKKIIYIIKKCIPKEYSCTLVLLSLLLKGDSSSAARYALGSGMEVTRRVTGSINHDTHKHKRKLYVENIYTAQGGQNQAAYATTIHHAVRAA
jgi:hypothetical protein